MSIGQSSISQDTYGRSYRGAREDQKSLLALYLPYEAIGKVILRTRGKVEE